MCKIMLCFMSRLLSTVIRLAHCTYAFYLFLFHVRFTVLITVLSVSEGCGLLFMSLIIMVKFSFHALLHCNCLLVFIKTNLFVQSVCFVTLNLTQFGI